MKPYPKKGLKKDSGQNGNGRLGSNSHFDVLGSVFQDVSHDVLAVET